MKKDIIKIKITYHKIKAVFIRDKIKKYQNSLTIANYSIDLLNCR